MWTDIRRRPGAVISGTAGVGKTALAVHWSHHGASPLRRRAALLQPARLLRQRSKTAADALTSFLLALGVSPANVPLDVDARLALFRSMTANRRMLLMLDNATSPDQVRPLIPANPHSAVVITSRNDLSGLKVYDDAADRRTGHAQRRGSRRPADEGARPEPARHLRRSSRDSPGSAHDCPGAADRGGSEHRAGAPTGGGHGRYVTALREGNRLRRAGDETAPERGGGGGVGSFPTPRCHRRRPGCSRFSARARCRCAGLEAVAALAGTSGSATAAMLDHLVRAHLVQRLAHRSGAGCTTSSACSAAQRCAAVDDERGGRRPDPPARACSVGRRSTCHGILHPGMLRLCGLPEPPAATWPATSGPAAWLEVERANLAASVHHAAERGPKAIAWQLTDVLRGYLWRNYDVSTWAAMARAGLEAAQGEGVQQAEAAMHYSLGAAYRYGLRDFHSAWRHLEQAQRMFRILGVRDGQAAALDSLGMVLHQAGETDRALAALGASLDICRQQGFLVGQAKVLCNLGLVLGGAGRFEEATRHLTEALSLAHRLHDRHMEAMAQHNLGQACRRHGLFGQAVQHYERALEIRDDIGDAEGKATTLDDIGTLLQATGQHASSRSYWRQAVAILEDLGHPRAVEVRARLSFDDPLQEYDDARSR